MNWGDFADDDTRTKRFQGAMEILATEMCAASRCARCSDKVLWRLHASAYDRH